MANDNNSNNNNAGSNSGHDDARHASNTNARRPQPTPSKKQALLQRKRQLQQLIEEREPWLFQSLNFPHSISLPALPQTRESTSSLTAITHSSSATNSLRSTDRLLLHTSASSPAPLSAFLDIDAASFAASSSIAGAGTKDKPFFLDVDSLKRLLPHTPHLRPKSSSGGGGAPYGSAHQSNNRPQQHSGRRSRHVTHAPVRLEALSGLATARRKKLKRKATAVAGAHGASSATTRKNALRLGGGKGRPVTRDASPSTATTATSAKPKHHSKVEQSLRRHTHQVTHHHHHHHQASHARSHSLMKAARRSSYDVALAYNSDDPSDDDEDDDDPLVLLEDMDEAKRQKMAIAAQLNLTLDEYEALDAAFGGDQAANGATRARDTDNDSDNEDGSMTDRYWAVFTQYDVDGSGAISPSELRKLLLESGEDMDDAELASVLAQADTDRDGEIDFDEFIGFMRARKRLLRVANHMGVTGTGPGASSSSSHYSASPAAASPASSATSPLPPLKMATLQSKRHLQQFDAHLTRPTPTCLRPGARVDLTQLRRELAISEFGIQELNTKVREGLHWVQQHCPVRSLKAQIFCHRWGIEKVTQLVARMQSQAIARALNKWRAFSMYERNKVQANRFLKCKASQKMSELMTKWRRKVTRRKLVKWKTECLRDARNELHCAAIELQRVLRGKLARLLLARLRATAAATTLQALVRGHLARCRVARIRRAKLEHECASLLQRCYRGYTGKRVARALFQAQREALAAMRIQRAFRNHQRRELLRVIQQTKLEHDCAIRIQCCVRRYLARCERARRELQRTRSSAAVVIQRHARGLLARRAVATLRRRNAAATTIQRRIRVFQARSRVHLMRRERLFLVQYARETAAVTVIQARWRCFYTRAEYLRMRLERLEAQRVAKLLELTSALTIQAAYRGYCARRVAQRARFEKLKWLNLTLMNRSALQIQACWRGYHGRLASHLRLQAKRALELEADAAARRIQGIARGKLARSEKRRIVQAREHARRADNKRVNAAVRIQTVFRGKQARRAVAKLQQEHRDAATRALEKLVQQTKMRAAVRIQCCVRRFLSRVRYLRKQHEAQQRKLRAEARLVQERAALVIQCAMRRAKAQRLLLQRRRDFERRISLMASEKAHDEIERLRQEQEDELRKLKLELLFQQSAANDEANKLREQVAHERAEEQARRDAEVEELAQLKAQTILLHQPSSKRIMELEKTQRVEQLRETLEHERLAQAQHEALTRTQENEELAALKLAALLDTSAIAPNQQQRASDALQDEAKQLERAALAIRREQATLTIQAICLKYIAKQRIAKLQRAQALQLASLHDEAERVRLQAVQEKEIALARLKAIMDEETRAREQELKALEVQMLERARLEKERVARRAAAACTIQSFARGYFGRQRVRVIQAKIARERDERAKAIEATLAAAEAKVAQVLASDATDVVGDDADAEAEAVQEDEWVEYWDENAQASYFYNIRTQEASWTRPVSPPSSTPASAKAMEIVLAATASAVDHEQDSYTNYSAEAVDANGYAANSAEGYADPYGYYDQYGQYHYYEEDPNAANAYSANAMASMYPGFASAYAYQAAMASMMFGFGNPMLQQFANPMLQQQQYASAAPAAAASEDVVADDATAAAPPDPWEKFFDQYTGAAYYYNSITGEKYWA